MVNVGKQSIHGAYGLCNNAFHKEILLLMEEILHHLGCIKPRE